MSPDQKVFIVSSSSGLFTANMVSTIENGTMATVLCHEFENVTPVVCETNYELLSYLPVSNGDHTSRQVENNSIYSQINVLQLQLSRSSRWDKKRISREIKHLRKQIV